MAYKYRVSIIVCTFNRADLLEATLQDLNSQIESSHLSAELVVVNNNSTDATEQIVQKFTDDASFPIKYFLEKRQGHTIARNTAVRACEGGIIVFTDDDVRIDALWLNNLCAVFTDTETMAAGGKIIPVWPERVPEWIGSTENPHFPGVVVKYDLGDLPHRIVRGESCPLGANMAFRQEVFDQIGLFREDLGHRGGMVAGGDDMEFFHRFLNRYPYITYVPSAIIYHPVPDNRLNKDYFLKYLYNASKNESLYEKNDHIKKIFGIPRYMIRSVLKNFIYFVYYSSSSNKSKSFFHQGSLYQIFGYVAGVFAHRNGKK